MGLGWSATQLLKFLLGLASAKAAAGNLTDFKISVFGVTRFFLLLPTFTFKVANGHLVRRLVHRRPEEGGSRLGDGGYAFRAIAATVAKGRVAHKSVLKFIF
jgi:hypothetical protein